MNITLRHIPAPAFGNTDPLPAIPAAEYAARCVALYDAAGADWVAVYADREHYANLTWLINFDPRFEEALLLLGPGSRRILLTGNEGMGYLAVLPIEAEVLLCQTFSLPGQARHIAPRLQDVLAHAGIRAGQRVSVVGWKYLKPEEAAPAHLAQPAFVPAFLVHVLAALVGPKGEVTDGTHWLMHPERGHRAANCASQIALFEWGARHASASVFGVLRGTRPGMTEMAAAQLLGYAGQPMTMHPIVTTGKDELNGLRSPTTKIIEQGDAISVAAGYWGSLVCRAGMLLAEPDEPFFRETVAPYFRGQATWYESMRIGATGGEIFAAVGRAFGDSGLRSSLNPGHLGSFEEWLHSPIRPDSTEQIRSGMVFQVDIIPTPLPVGYTLNCEDTIAVADEALQSEMRAHYPEMWARIEARRQFMAEALGIRLAAEILPLTDAPAYLPPFWGAPELVCAVE